MLFQTQYFHYKFVSTAYCYGYGLLCQKIYYNTPDGICPFQPKPQDKRKKKNDYYGIFWMHGLGDFYFAVFCKGNYLGNEHVSNKVSAFGFGSALGNTTFHGCASSENHTDVCVRHSYSITVCSRSEGYSA